MGVKLYHICFDYDLTGTVHNLLQTCHSNYRKSSIKPPGGLFNFRHSRGGLNGQGGLLDFRHSRGGLNGQGGLLERGAYSQNQMTWIQIIAFQLFFSIIYGFNVQFYKSNA